LVGSDGRKRIIYAVDAAARDAGLRVGMAAIQAQIVAPGLIIQDADPMADAAGLERLAIWILERFSPIVAADRPDGIVIDATGAEHLHGGEQAMLSKLVARLQVSGIGARAAIADTWGVAHALARYAAAPMTIVPQGGSEAALAPLPVAALRLPGDMVTSLRVLGFERVSNLLAQPRAPLSLRFGPELGRRIDQALGHATEPIQPVRPPDLIETRRVFGEPIGAAETIARYIGKLVPELCQQLEAKGLGVRRLDLVCHRVDSTLQVVRVGTAAPVRDSKRLSRLLCDRIECIDPGWGIELMALAATVAEPMERRQAATSLVDDSPPDVSDLVDTLANRVGERRLYRAAPVASDVPERSVERVPALAPETGATWTDKWPRPARLLSPPEPVETMALLPDHPPIWFTWRGARRRIRRADGPERVLGEWWKRDPELVSVRDYFRVEDEAGERYWLYRAGDGEDAATGSQGWFIHGVFG
jgi:protein ImuB